MSYDYLIKRAYGLCIEVNQYIVLNDLFMMTDVELLGLINFLSGLRDS